MESEVKRKVVIFKITINSDDIEKAKDIANAIMTNTVVDDRDADIYDMEWECEGIKGPQLTE